MTSHRTLLCPFFLVPLLLGVTPPLTFGETIEHAGANFFVYRVDPGTEKIELFLSEKSGEPNTFPKLDERIRAKGRRLKFAMNSGIFEGTFLPSGLHIADGKTVTKLNLNEFVKTREGEFTPNFFLKPNGVFFIRADGSAAVVETTRYAALNEKPVLATQSGPLLVQETKIHPVLTPDSTSERYRNGVGVSTTGQIIFVCSILDRDLGMSNLYHFAELFRDKLNCPNALYLDGDISYVFIEGETAPIRETNWFVGILAITEPLP
ncbi:MAG: phosphodiester glycosidase family protein [Verrucomicrobiales bacterium]|nr:phosphodiester glycosidase family protein [Verrucomicrobiales bacterium]